MTAREWLDVLEAELNDRLERTKLYEAYFRGDHRLKFATSKFKEAFGDLFEAFSTNWCSLVVNAPVQRLGVQGFRFGGVQHADMDAWGIWQANRMDAESIKAHEIAIKSEVAYVLVSPAKNGVPQMTIEHPLQVIVAHDPADRRIRLAALKKYRDERGDDVAIVLTPDTVTTFKSVRGARRLQGMGLDLPVGVGEWEQATEEPNPLGVVEMVPIENCPDLLTGGTSDLKPAIALNDAANKFFSDMLVASEYAAFPQRVLTGVELPEKDENGVPTELKAAISRVWAFAEENAKAYDLKPAELGNYVTAMDAAIQHIAAQTQTPPHYLLAKLINISGDALKAAETGLISRVKRKHVDFGDPWEEAMRLAFRWRARARRRDGDTAGAELDEERATATDSETIWVDPESRTLGEVADAATKKQAMGIPDEVVWEDMGYSPQQIDRMVAMKQANLLLEAASKPQPEPQPVAG